MRKPQPNGRPPCFLVIGANGIAVAMSFCGALVFAAGGEAGAQTLFRIAENQVPVAVVEVIRTPSYTEVHLQTQQPRPNVCWTAAGPNSPYLLTSGHRYRFISGDHVTTCPQLMNYGASEIMVLRFEPLGAQVHEFSLVEGQGGENQMIDPASDKKVRYWNFLHIQLH